MLWNLWKAIILGIVEGVTEWLPISSTGHLILVDGFLKMQASAAFMEMFNVVIQLGAILAVVVVYFHKLNPFSGLKNVKEKRDTWQLWKKVVVACLPAGILGVLLNDWLDAHFYNAVVVSCMLVLYGVLFIVVERRNKAIVPAYKTLNSISIQTALLIGAFQVLSLIPGTSRSGATIIGAILLGCSRFVATEFSFFLGIPVMFGASGLKMLKFFTKHSLPFDQGIILILGMIVAFVVSIVVIKFLMSYLRKHDFTVFGWYRILLGALVLLFWFVSK